jgi:monothiol glutaredoxin
VIDWVSTVQGEGLSLKFPGAQEIKPLSVHELKALLEADQITLIDVRPAHGRAMAERFAAHGFSNVHNVEGGMDAWTREVDSDVPRY